MTMLTAKEILERHPQGCWVFDATGRRLEHVMACNPETGEVVMWCQAWSPLQWLIRLLPRPRSAWTFRLFRTGIPRRHGFWPAPLHLVPKPIWNGDPEQYAPVPRRGGRVSDGQAYIVGNGEREQFTPRHSLRDRLAAGATDSKPQRKLTLSDIDALVDAMDAMDGGNGEREARL